MKSLPLSEKRHCNHCKMEVHTVIQVLSSGPHHAKETCNNCGRFVCFTKKPKNHGKRPKNKHTSSSLGISHCQMCLRPACRLGRRGVLEVHHVIEIQAGGEDTPENIWAVCSSCHRLIHHQRTYLNEHLQGHYSLEDLQTDMARDRVPQETQMVLRRIFERQREASNA